jgi:NADH-quinone oxidoreductase subunit N
VSDNLLIATIWMPSAGDLRLLAPLWSIVGTIVLLLVSALIVGRNWRIISGIAALGAALTAAICWQGFQSNPGNFGGISPNAAQPMLIVDQFSYFFIFLSSVFLVFVTGMWYLGQQNGGADYLARRGDVVEFFVLLLGSAFGMALMVSTSNLLMIVLAVETASLPSYGLAGFRKKHRLSAEASLKYVLFGAVTSAIMIYGASLLYGQYHTLDLALIGKQISHDGASLIMGVGIFAFMVGVAFKVSAVPFHFWCPDVFEGAAIEVTTWLSVASKAAGLGLMLRIISVLTSSMSAPDLLHSVSVAVAIMAALTCTVGNFSAFRQTNLKRLLAFSSIAHAGYMLMAVAIIWRPQFNQTDVVHPAFSAIIIYASVYVLMNLGAFGTIAMIYWATGREDIGAFAGLGRRNPILAILMTVCLFSLVGLPPFGGFMAKWYLLLSLYDAGLIWLIFVAVFNTLISLYYYARIAYAMYFTESDEPPVRTPVLGQAVVAMCALGIVLIGTIFAGRIKTFGDARATDLYGVVQSSSHELQQASTVRQFRTSP